jgi:hypothetical protein
MMPIQFGILRRPRGGLGDFASLLMKGNAGHLHIFAFINKFKK